MEVPPSVEITDGQRLETEQLQDESSMDGVQQTGEQQIGEQQTGKQQSGEQQIGEERIEEQQMVDQQLGEQQTGEPQTGEQEMWGIRDGGRVLVSGTTTAPVRRSTRITRGVPPLSGEQIRGLCRAVQCLAKVAHSDYITFLAAPVEVRRERLLWILWRYDVNDSCGGINTAKTAYLVVNFATDYFQTFHLSHPTCSCSALVKSVLAVFRTAPAAMRTLTITADGKEPDNIRWIIDCQNGMRKTYTIACVNDREVLSASIDPSTYPSSLVARPKALLQLLNHFQSTLSEITIIAADPEDVTGSGTGTGGGAAGRGGGSEAKAVEMRSYVEPTLAGGCSADGRLEAFPEAAKHPQLWVGSSADGRLEASPEAAMHTQLWVDPGEHFEAYCHRGDAVDVTFSVKEVKAFVQFCESAAADVVMLFHRAGAPRPFHILFPRHQAFVQSFHLYPPPLAPPSPLPSLDYCVSCSPLMLMPRFPNPHTTPTRNPRHAHAPLASDFDSRLVIATMLESQLPTPPPSDPSVHRASAQPGTPATPAHQAAATFQASAEAGAPVHKGLASRTSAEAGTPTVAASGSQRSCHAGSGADPHQAYPIGSGCREDPGGGGLGEGEEEGADEMRGEEGAEKVPLKDPGAGARLEAGWAHGKRWSDLSGAKGTAHRPGADSAGLGGGEGSGRGRRGSSTWPREQQQPLPGHAQQDQRQQQHDQYQQKLAANQVPDSEDATEELPIGRLAAASRGGSGGGGGGVAGGCNTGGSVDGNGMVTGGAADVSAARFMPTEASTPGRLAAPHQQAPPLQRDPDRWIENTEDDEMEDRAGGCVRGRLGEDMCEGIGDEDEYVDATPPERRMYDDEDETMD
ncbi:unnamed protein product [Closterium sp. NIES-65]|nr:unnamed protein product [Closterium sp. NIES-65]